jgi:hypothetical protein
MKQSLWMLGLTMIALAVAAPAFATAVVPEIDPSMVSSGLAALVGGVLVLTGRRRK